jgi:hypothetical protein
MGVGDHRWLAGAGLLEAASSTHALPCMGRSPRPVDLEPAVEPVRLLQRLALLFRRYTVSRHP